MEANTFFKFDDRYHYPPNYPYYAWRWRLWGFVEGYFIFQSQGRLQPFVKIHPGSMPIRGSAFSVGFIGAAIRRFYETDRS